MESKIKIRELVAEKLLNLSQRTREAVIEHFAGIEAKKQSEAIIAGLNKLDELEKELKKIKPVFQSYNEAGNGLGVPSYTKESNDKRQGILKDINNLTAAINSADDRNDFAMLYQLVKK